MRSQKKGRVQQRPIYFSLENSRSHQLQETVDEHFADAVEALLEDTPLFECERKGAGRQSRNRILELRIVTMTRDETVHSGVGFLTNADLQRAPIGYEACHVQSDRMFANADRFLWRSKERKRIGRRIQNVGKFLRQTFCVGRHEGEFVVDLTRENKLRVALPPCLEQIECNVGVAAEAEARAACAFLFRNKLGNDVHAAFDQIT